MGKTQSLAKNIALLLSSLLFVLVLLEVAVRLLEPREVMRYFFMSPDSVVDHRFTPGASGHYKTPEFDVLYTINALGLRDREIALKKPPGTKRILMLGDSFTEGDGVSQEETFSSVLQKRLDSISIPQQWQVINAGVGSYSPLLEYLYLVHHGLKLDPDLVVLNFDLSDVYDDITYSQRARFDDHGIPLGVSPESYPVPDNRFPALLMGIKDFAKHHLRLYNFIRLRIDRYLEAARHNMNTSGDVRFDKYAFLRPGYVPNDSDWALSQRYLRMIRDTVRAHGADFWVTVYPYGLQVGKREWHSGRQYWGFRPDTIYSTLPQQAMEDFCIRSGIPAINMCEDFQREHLSVAPLYIDYNGHWLPAGHAVVARRLFQAIKAYALGGHPTTGN
jgi:hypothetical protein